MACIVQHSVEEFQPRALLINYGTVGGVEESFEVTKGESFRYLVGHLGSGEVPANIPLQPQFPSPFTGRKKPYFVHKAYSEHFSDSMVAVAGDYGHTLVLTTYIRSVSGLEYLSAMA